VEIGEKFINFVEIGGEYVICIIRGMDAPGFGVLSISTAATNLGHEFGIAMSCRNPAPCSVSCVYAAAYADTQLHMWVKQHLLSLFKAIVETSLL